MPAFSRYISNDSQPFPNWVQITYSVINYIIPEIPNIVRKNNTDLYFPLGSTTPRANAQRSGITPLKDTKPLTL